MSNSIFRNFWRGLKVTKYPINVQAASMEIFTFLNHVPLRIVALNEHDKIWILDLHYIFSLLKTAASPQLEQLTDFLITLCDFKNSITAL